MGKPADCVQKTVIDTLYKEGKPQKVIAKEVGWSQSAVSKHIHRKLSEKKSVVGRDAPATWKPLVVKGLPSKIHSRFWGSFTRRGLRMESAH